MKKTLKQTGITLSLVLLSSGFAIANENNIVSEKITPPVTQIEGVSNSDIVKPKQKNKLQRKPKIKKVTTAQEIKMSSQGNFNSSINNWNKSSNVENHSKDLSIQGNSFYSIPLVNIPGIYNNDSKSIPLDMTVGFNFKDSVGYISPSSILVNQYEQGSKNISLYQINSDLSSINTVSIYSPSELFSGKYKLGECQIIFYEYEIAGSDTKSLERFVINDKGEVTQEINSNCKVDKTHKHENTVVDSNGYFMNITWKQYVSMESVPQSFMFQAVKDGKKAHIQNAVAYIFDDSFKTVKTVLSTKNKQDDLFFNDINLKEGTYKIIVKYTVDNKENQIINSRNFHNK